MVKEGLIAKQAGRCEELQMLKFGQLVDIAALDKISVNNDEAELRVKSSALEISNEQEIFRIHAKHRQLKEQLLDLTNLNTARLNRIAELNGRQFFLEKELNGNKNGMQVVDDGPTLRAETEERNRLVALVKLQAKEVDALKAEINLLRRKGGHIYVSTILFYCFVFPVAILTLLYFLSSYSGAPTPTQPFGRDAAQ